MRLWLSFAIILPYDTKVSNICLFRFIWRTWNARYTLRWVRSSWTNTEDICPLVSCNLFPLSSLRYSIMSSFTRLLTNFTSMGRGTCDGDDLSCVTSRLLGSSEDGLTPSTRAGTVVALADSSRGTGWSAGAGWSIWPEGRDGFPTRWVTSRSSVEIASSWCWQHVTPWYQCPRRCFQGPRICEPNPSYRAAPSRHISVPIPRSDLIYSG